MKTFFDDMVKEEKEITMLFATGRAYAKLPFYMKNWDKKINDAKINIRVLLNSDGNKKPYKNYKYGKVKILPKNFSTPTQIFIYGNKSAVAIWSEEPIAIHRLADIHQQRDILQLLCTGQKMSARQKPPSR